MLGICFHLIISWRRKNILLSYFIGFWWDDWGQDATTWQEGYLHSGFFFFLTFEVIPVTQAYVLLNKLCLHYRSWVENWAEQLAWPGFSDSECWALTLRQCYVLTPSILSKVKSWWAERDLLLLSFCDNMRDLCMFDFASSPRIGCWCSMYQIQPCGSLDLWSPWRFYTSAAKILIPRCNTVFRISLYSWSSFSIFRSPSSLISAILAL